MSETGGVPPGGGGRKTVLTGITGVAVGAVATLALSGGLATNNPQAQPTPASRVYFSPQGGCTQAITDAIRGARNEILVHAYAFDSREIADALIEAHRRGVRVVVIMDRSQAENARNVAKYLSENGVTVLVDDQHSAAHDKVIIIDGSLVLTGSFNFTTAAESRNGENLLALREAPIITQYRTNWERHRGHSRPFQPGGQGNSPPPITADDALNRLGQLCTVDLQIAGVGTYKTLIFLNSRSDRNDPQNFAVVIYPEAMPSHFGRWAAFRDYWMGVKGRTARVVGTVTEYNGRPQIEVRTADQLRRLPEAQ
jgi:phosphatidylserine/phosphatidylglycerophosphate/cardiolipin synthase-like enzyme